MVNRLSCPYIINVITIDIMSMLYKIHSTDKYDNKIYNANFIAFSEPQKISIHMKEVKYIIINRLIVTKSIKCSVIRQE